MLPPHRSGIRRSTRLSVWPQLLMQRSYPSSDKLYPIEMVYLNNFS